MTKSMIKPTDKIELQKIILEEIKKQGETANLNHIDVSGITDMSGLFYRMCDPETGESYHHFPKLSSLREFDGDIIDEIGARFMLPLLFRVDTIPIGLGLIMLVRILALSG